MKLFISLILAFFLGSAVRADSASTGSPVTMTVAPEHTFIPPGFDDNDHAELVIAGTLANECYKVAPPLQQIDRAAKKILITNRIYYYPGVMCLELRSPYSQTIDLGVLPQGDYQVVSLDDQGKEHIEGTLPIAPAKSAAADDYLYALIDQAFVVQSADGTWLRLGGRLQSDCMSLQETRVLYRTPNIIEVLPIAAYNTDVFCTDMPRTLDKRVALESPWKGLTLIHIRSLNGQAVNRVVEF